MGNRPDLSTEHAARIFMGKTSETTDYKQRSPPSGSKFMKNQNPLLVPENAGILRMVKK